MQAYKRRNLLPFPLSLLFSWINPKFPIVSDNTLVDKNLEMFLVRQVAVIMNPELSSPEGPMDDDRLSRFISAFNGRILKMHNGMAFGLFDAVSAVISCSKAMYNYQPGPLYPDQPIILHYGEVFIRGNQAYGHGLDAILHYKRLAPGKGIYLTKEILEIGKTEFAKGKITQMHDNSIQLFPMPVFF